MATPAVQINWNAVVEMLRDARDRIKDRSRWCQGASALDINGESVSPESDRARQWCAHGSLVRTAAKTGYANDFDGEAVDASRILDFVAKEYDSDREDDITSINDIYGHRAVIDSYNRAIEEVKRLKGRE